MKKLLLISFLFVSIVAKAAPTLLTPEEKAFLYHVIMKSPVLERNISDLVHFKGDSLVYGEKVDYDLIEEQIIYEPSLLEINIQGFTDVSPGLLSELTTKMALYALHLELKKRNEDTPEGYSDRIFKHFMGKLAEEMPSVATRDRNNVLEITPKLDGLLDPSFSMNEKISFVRELGLFSVEDQRKVLDAYHSAIDIYTQEKALDYFLMLGGKRGSFQNTLLAAGDGSGTAGLLGERKAGKPKGIGLFTYQTKIFTNMRNWEQIEVKKAPQRKFQLIGEGKTTNLHLSIWGFNSIHQTTVVLKHLGKSYLFYANKESKELSPDTAFSGGKTYHRLIIDVEKKIGELQEGLFGKLGFEYWKDYYTEKLEETKMAILACEAELNVLRSNSLKNKKKISKQQEKYVRLHTSKSNYSKKLEEAKYNLKHGHDDFKKYKMKLAQMNEYLGHDRQEFEKIGSVYVFEDGSIFDANTQDFKFSDITSQEDIYVRLIAIGGKAFNKNVDEIQLHVNLTKGKEIERFYDEFNLKLKDVFHSDHFMLDSFELDDFQKFQIRRIAKKLGTPSTTAFASVAGKGIGAKTENGIEASLGMDWDQYPGPTAADRERIKKSRMFSDLRMSRAQIYFRDSSLYVDIESFTDPVRSKMHLNKPLIKAHFEKKLASGNEVLSTLRSYYLYEVILDEIALQAKKELSGDEKAKCLERLKKLRDRIKANCNDKLEVGYLDYLKFKQEFGG
jgi:hypothetical protein